MKFWSGVEIADLLLDGQRSNLARQDLFGPFRKLLEFIFNAYAF